jgi:hypothetical protein
MNMYVCIISTAYILDDQKVSEHLTMIKKSLHRIHSECGPCYTEHGLREHNSACQYMSGDWRRTL